MKYNQLIKFHNNLTSNLSKDHIDPFYNRASLDLLSMIFDYVENQEGIVLNDENSFSALADFFEENKKNRNSANNIYKSMLLINPSNSPVSLSFMDENTLEKVYSYIGSLLTSTLANNNEKGTKIIIDSKGYMNKEELVLKGYSVKRANLEELNNSNSWNPYKELEQLEKEDPIKYQEVIKELETLIKNDDLNLITPK